jgi:hypothetical protein
LPFAERLQIDHGAEGAANEALDLLASPRLTPRCRLPARSFGRRPRQHPIFGGDPAPALAFHPRRDPLLKACCAKHVSIPEFDKARSFRMKRESALEANGAQIARLPFRGAHRNLYLIEWRS